MGQGLDFLDGRGLPQGLTGFLIFLLPSASQGQAVLTNWISAIEPEDKGNEMEFNSASETKLDCALLLFVFLLLSKQHGCCQMRGRQIQTWNFLGPHPGSWLAGRIFRSVLKESCKELVSFPAPKKIPGAPRHAT